MKLENLQKAKDGHFRRVVGVKRTTFCKMVEIVKEAYVTKHRKGGRPNKLSVEEMILMTLEYLREYRTYASIGVSYGLAECNAFQTIRWVEDVLVKCGLFALPGKKALHNEDLDIEVIVIDATESPIERPKKNNANTTLGRKSSTL